MKKTVEFLFESAQLKSLPRSGYQFLGAGSESVAEHLFMTAVIGLVMSRKVKNIDPLRLVSMCLLHDLPEARIGDINYLQKRYVKADEKKAVADMTRGLFMGKEIAELMEEFNAGTTTEARLARDADQLALLLDLKSLADDGSNAAGSWIRNVKKRLGTETGRNLCKEILSTRKDSWWHDQPNRTPIKG